MGAKKDSTGAGTPAYKRPPTPAEKAEFGRELKTLRDGELKPFPDDEAESKLDLSPEEIARLEAEKAALLAELAQDTAVAKAAGPKIEAKPRHPGAPPTPADALADQGAPRFGLAEQSTDPTTPLTLAVRARKLKDAMAATQAFTRGEIEQKKQAVVARLQPLIAQAKVTLAEVKVLFKQHEEALTLLADSTWETAPANWSPDLRLRAQSKLFVPASRLREQFWRFLNEGRGVPGIIADAEQVMAIGWSSSSSWPGVVSEREQAVGHLARTADVIASFTNELALLNQELERIDGQAAAFHGRKPEVVVEIVMTGDARRGRVAEALYKAQHPSSQQTYGEGAIEGI